MVEEFLGKDLISLEDFKTPFKHWWVKLELFAPWTEYLRPCVFFDLDTYIVDDSRHLLDFEGFHLIRDFYTPKRSNSGVMLIPKDTSYIWNRVEDLQGNEFHGDGDFLTTLPHKVIQDSYDGIVSYKAHCRKRPCGKVICFHGKPKPHESDGWAQEIWKKYKD